MAKLICPHCGKPGIAAWRKQFLGPARSIACDACGGRVSVPMSSLLAALPIVAGILLGSQFGNPAALWISVAIGVAMTVLIHTKFVPLVKR